MDTFKVGQPVRYISSSGYVKAGQIIATHESIHPDGGVIQPQQGHAHLVVWGLATGPIYRPDIPVREVAESIPDYTVEGQLVGFFEVA